MISRRLKKFYKIKYSKIEESFLISYNFTWKIKLENSKIPNSEFQKFEKIYICLKTRLNSKFPIPKILSHLAYLLTLSRSNRIHLRP